MIHRVSSNANYSETSLIQIYPWNPNVYVNLCEVSLMVKWVTEGRGVEGEGEGMKGEGEGRGVTLHRLVRSKLQTFCCLTLSHFNLQHSDPRLKTTTSTNHFQYCVCVCVCVCVSSLEAIHMLEEVWGQHHSDWNYQVKWDQILERPHPVFNTEWTHFWASRRAATVIPSHLSSR